MLEDDPVPSGEKLVSMFEPHTQIIPRFRAGAAAEFGREIRLDEVDGGSSRGFAVLEKRMGGLTGRGGGADDREAVGGGRSRGNPGE